MLQGDRNTTFYHVSTLVRRKRNQILAIKNSVGEWIQEEKEIENFIRKGFGDIYTSSLTASVRAMPAISQWQGRLNEEEKESIGGQVTIEEIKSAFWSLKAYKASSPDELHVGFFHSFSQMVGHLVVREVKIIFMENKVPEYLNLTHIALIPKIQNPKTIGNYQPISLCNTIYKVVAKIIVARLRPYLEKLISPLQTAFVPRRKGIDNAIIV